MIPSRAERKAGRDNLLVATPGNYAVRRRDMKRLSRLYPNFFETFPGAQSAPCATDSWAK